MKNFYCAMMIVTAVLTANTMPEVYKVQMDKSERRTYVAGVMLDSALWPLSLAAMVYSEVSQ